MSLEQAVRNGDLAAARAELREGADVNFRGLDGFTPLMVAASLGHPRMVALLMEAGADPHIIETQMGATALHKAAQSGNPEVIGLLLDHGAFVDQQSPILGNTPLIDAVLHMHEAAVKLFLARGARTNIRNHWQQSALDLARESGPEVLVRALEARAAADAEQAAGLTLIAAVRAGDAANVERLIDAGVDLNGRLPAVGRVDDDYTALGIAVRERRTKIVELLLDAGADPHATLGLMRGTSIHEASFLGFADVLRLILVRVADDLNAAGPYNGLTALHDAVWHGHFAAAEALIEAGASLLARTHTGLTPRELAVLYGHDDLQLMLARGEQVRSTHGSGDGRR